MWQYYILFIKNINMVYNAIFKNFKIKNINNSLTLY